MRGLDYRWIDALAAVVDNGSFEQAAAHLFISQSAVSQRIKQLEKFVAQPVLIREQPPKPTYIGTKLLGLGQRVSILEQELLPELGGELSERPIPLSIASNADSLATWLLPALDSILKSHRVELKMKVDSEDRTIDKLKSGEVAAAISLESKAIAGCNAQYLGKMDYLCVASPEFVERYFPKGVDKSSLQKAPCLSFDHKDPLHREFLKQEFDLDIGETLNHQIASSEAFVQAALSGVIYCLIPRVQIENELASGLLVDCLPNKKVTHCMYWHHWELESDVMKEITEAILSHARRTLPQ
ncbi:LysR family transcriptional regulator ArgP [Vibrio sonorensis]|uniref:LysR family transcriptional regulator ArgP n=1 Tax=Vibrio sonorensis TaxID=1004316 RepID=UPI0008D9AAD8|nr:LysR family transcriptional regulator ArgP [Vibrio sonorensis]